MPEVGWLKLTGKRITLPEVIQDTVPGLTCATKPTNSTTVSPEGLFLELDSALGNASLLFSH